MSAGRNPPPSDEAPKTPPRIIAVDVPATDVRISGPLETLPTSGRLFEGRLPDPIRTLETNLMVGGTSLIGAIFNNTFLLHPSLVRRRTPLYPGFARYSRRHYGRAVKGAAATWRGEPVRLDDNSRAQMAWQEYSGRALSRGAGYAIRHIWGHPWDPIAYTAGWNLAYMPNWAGMLTEVIHRGSGVSAGACWQPRLRGW